MGQKSYFKAKQTNTFIKRYTFPQIPGVEIENPKTMKTITGTDLLIDGLWGVLRKPSESTKVTYNPPFDFVDRY